MMTWLLLIICYKKQLIDKFTTIYGYNEQIMMIPNMFANFFTFWLHFAMFLRALILLDLLYT